MRHAWRRVPFPDRLVLSVTSVHPACGEAGWLSILWKFVMTSPAHLRVHAAAKPLAMAVAVATAFSASAFAQEKKLESVVVTATRSPQIAKEVLSDNVVITAEDIAKSGGTSLADVLQRQRGIEISRTGGPGTQTSVFLRGTDNKQNIVLVDGVRVGSATSGGASWNAIPLSQIDRVEVVYGPLSTMYGADAVGGVIQIFTKQGDGAPAPTASAGIGTYGTRNVEAGVSGSNQGFRYALRAAHERSDGFSAKKPSAGASSYNPDRDGHDSTSAGGQLGFQIAKGHEVGVTFLHNVLKSQFDSGPAMDDRSRTRVAAYSVYAKNRILPNWDSHVQVSRSADHSTSDASFGHTVYDTNQTSISWQNNFKVGATDVFQVIAEHRKEDVDSTTAAVARERTTNSIAAAYQLRHGAHLGALSLRNDDNSQFGSRTTGSVSYGYRITNALRANASFGTSFRAPTFNELYFPQFGIASNRPEKGRNAEIGLYYEDGKSQVSAVYYRNRLTDLLVNTTVCPVEQATHRFGCAYNVNKALLTGLSLGASTMLGSFTLRGSLDLQDPKDETTGRQLQRRAKKHGTVGLDHTAGAVTSGGEVVFSGDRYDDTNNRNRLGGYGLLNLYANYEFAKNWTVFGRWNNVLDKDYQLARHYNTAGSNVFVGVRYGMK
jgi:vitamin B12 transporter